MEQGNFDNTRLGILYRSPILSIKEVMNVQQQHRHSTVQYNGDFGSLLIDFTNWTVEGDLDTNAIWRVAGGDAMEVQRIYEDIGLKTVDDGHDGEYFGYGFDRTASGVVLENGDMRLAFEADGPVRFI
jgi:hypothetical protein